MMEGVYDWQMKWNETDTNEIINKKFIITETEQCIFLIFNSFLVLFYIFFFCEYTTFVEFKQFGFFLVRF